MRFTKAVEVAICMMAMAMLVFVPAVAFEVSINLADIPEVTAQDEFGWVLRVGLHQADEQFPGCERISQAVSHDNAYLIVRYMSDNERGVAIGNQTAVIDLTAISPAEIEGIGTSTADMRRVS